MPNPTDYMWKQIKAQDVDDQLLETAPVKNLEKRVTDFADNVLDKIKTSKTPELKKTTAQPPLKPINPIPTELESAFIKPKKETTLFNVTNTEEKTPSTKVSLKKNISLRVRSLNLFTNYKFDKNKTLSLITGEKVGVMFKNRQSSVTNSIKGEYNISNQKTALTYKHSDLMGNFSASVFQQKGNIGGTCSYSNHNGFNSAFSIDKRSAAIDCNYSKQIDKNTNLEVGAFVASDKNFSNTFAGVTFRMHL